MDRTVTEPLSLCGPRQLSRYSDSLRAARSGNRIPVGAGFSAPAQSGSEAHPAPYNMATSSSPGVRRPGRGSCTPHLGLRCMFYVELSLFLNAWLSHDLATFTRIFTPTCSVWVCVCVCVCLLMVCVWCVFVNGVVCLLMVCVWYVFVNGVVCVC